MKTEYVILSAAAVIPLLTSCASYQKTAGGDAPSIKPIFSIRNSSEKPDDYYQLGRYYQGQNRYDQALASYQKALAMDSGHAEARNGVGVILAMQGRLAEAIQQLRLVAGKGSAHIDNNLGYALYLNGSYDEAVQVLEQAARLDPFNQSISTNLAQAKTKLGSVARALDKAPQAPLPEKAAAEAAQVQPQAQPQVIVSAPINPPAVAAIEVAHQPEQAPVTARPLEAVAEHKAVPVVESQVQVVQVAPNIYELRERVEPKLAPAPAEQAQASAEPKEKGLIMPEMQVRHKPARIAEGRIHVGPLPQVEHEHAIPQAAAVAAVAAKPFRVEVSNGNGLIGMARKVAAFLEDFGYENSRLTNQKPFRAPSSEVQYRAGYRDEARALTASLPGNPALIESGNLRRDVSVRIVLGKDWVSDVAYFKRIRYDKNHLARAD